MKKWLLAFLLIIGLLLAFLYIFIPTDLKISKISVVRCSINGAYRTTSDQRQWNKWWPESVQNNTQKKALDSNEYVFNSIIYQLTQKSPYTCEIKMISKDMNLTSNVSFISLGIDSVIATWSLTYSVNTLNPLKKIQQYQKAKAIKKDISFLSEKLSSFLSNPANIYGITIAKTSTTDTSLIATRNISDNYPSTPDVYTSVNLLKKYIKENHARETGYPMINITKNNDGKYQTMVAIPTNIELRGNDVIFYRHMVPGNFFATEVKGGEYTVNKGLDELYFFMQDYQKTIMAIPFQVMITDRSVEQDTSKWITKIYMPALR
ncbi:MAG: hypothetical protein JST87_02250 [Bacteroidetes bacterium]|nr:hypothetical protein [Bacteroidota bacterium]MBS1932518.1 hypothetical protein [Bacteroidota bacterium]